MDAARGGRTLSGAAALNRRHGARAGGELVAIAPLMIVRAACRRRHGSSSWAWRAGSDYLDLIVRAGHEPASAGRAHALA